jgi:hypothetical protein
LLARRLLVFRYRKTRARLLAARRAPEAEQTRALLGIALRGRATEFGRTHGFDEIRDAASFAARVPVRRASELEPYLRRIARGEEDVLVPGRPLGLVLVGAASGRGRLLPVTRSGLDLLGAVEELLLHEIASARPRAMRGDLLHVLPLCAATVTVAGEAEPVPIRSLHELRGASAPVEPPDRLPPSVPASVFAIPDETARFGLLLRLALERDVTVIRAACPGTLAVLAEHLALQSRSLLEDLAAGKIRGLDLLSEEDQRALPPPRPDPERAARLSRVAGTRGRLEPRDAWPRLEVIVCATTGPSASAAERLADRYGNLLVLDPGLAGAEGVLTHPFERGDRGGVIHLGGQLLEFLPSGGAVPIPPVELRPVERYRPVVTSGNGLHRFILPFEVEVVGSEGGLPRLALLEPLPTRARLDEGALEEESVREAVEAAARGREIQVRGLTSWLDDGREGDDRDERSPAGGAGDAGDERGSAGASAPTSWLRRLFSRRARSTETRGETIPTRPRPTRALLVAVEPEGALDAARLGKLAVAIDLELRRRSRPFETARAKRTLGEPRVELLKPGALSRWRHRLLAEGAEDGHDPLPVLAESCPFPRQELEGA